VPGEDPAHAAERRNGILKRCLTCDSLFDGPNWKCPVCGYAPGSGPGYLAFAPELADANDGFSAGYFAKLAPLEAHSFWFTRRNRLVTWALRHYFPRAETLLEIGCGTGFVLGALHRAFPGLRLYGSEIFREALTFVRARLPEATLFQMDARRLPFRDEFDVVGAFDVLEHVEDDETVLAEIFRATRPGGGIMLTVPQHRHLWSVVDELSFHKRRYSRRELVEKVSRAGFAVVQTTSFVFFPLPLMVLSRLSRRHLAREFDRAGELKLSPPVNYILGCVLDVERALIQRGVSLPVGGSLLLVARRER
jgi:SAM-dependent methyltransferase